MDEPLLIPAAPALFAMYGAPSPVVGLRLPIVVFVSAGLTHRVGPNGLYRKLAAICAELGFGTVRVDLSGVGESPVSTASEQEPLRSRQEVRATFDFLNRTRACTSFVVAGICTGAEVAFEVARTEPRVCAALMINGLLDEQRVGQLDSLGLNTLSVFSDGSASFRAGAAALPRASLPKANVTVVRDCDHLFTPLSCQTELCVIVRDWMVQVRHQCIGSLEHRHLGARGTELARPPYRS